MILFYYSVCEMPLYIAFDNDAHYSCSCYNACVFLFPYGFSSNGSGRFLTNLHKHCPNGCHTLYFILILFLKVDEWQMYQSYVTKTTPEKKLPFLVSSSVIIVTVE